MKRLDWYIARRYLASSRRKGRFLSLITLIAMGGVLLGVMALITVIAVMTGLQRDLQQKILGSNPHIFVFEQGRGFRMGNWKSVLSKVSGPGIRSVEPFVLTQVVITPGAEYAQPGTLYGIDPTSPTPMTVVAREIKAGRLSLGKTPSGKPAVLLGRRLADKLGVLPGDYVTIGSMENLKKGPLGEIIPRMGQFEVSGVFTTGMYEYDSQNMYASIPAVQEMLGIGPDTISGIAVNVNDPWQAKDIGDKLARQLGYPYWTNDWTTLNQSLFSALKLEKIAMGLILLLIVVVAAFNIVTQLIMVVTDKTKEIGILKSMGMSDRTVLHIFMLQGLAIGFIGTVLGAAGGLGLVWLLDKYHFISIPGDVYFLDTLPVALDPWDVVLIIGASVAIAFVATIYPARRASRLLPVEAIRHD
jgi:lipoprotein-releasing system permease protein